MTEPPKKPGNTTRREAGKTGPVPKAQPAEPAPAPPPAAKKPAGQTSVKLPRPSSPTTRPAGEGSPKTQPGDSSTNRMRPPPTAMVRAPRREAAEPTRIRRGAASPRGMSLRAKLILSMGGIIVTAAVLILIVVSTRTSRILNEEINNRGERLTEVLASVDPEYWLAAIHGGEDRGARETQFKDVIGGFKRKDKWEESLNAPANKIRRELLVDPFSVTRQEEADELFRSLAEDPAKWKEDLSDTARASYDKLVGGPRTGKVKPLRDLAGNPDLVEVAVIDVSKRFGASYLAVVAGGNVMELSQLPEQQGEELITIKEKSIGTTPARNFLRNPAKGDRYQLRYMVSLSTRQIQEAQKSLLFFILMPILVSAVVAILVAIVVAQRITQPVKILIEDINQVSAGHLDHQTQAHSKDEIGVLADTFNRMTGALRAAREQELEQKALEHELGIAAEIQQNLVPKKMLKLPGFDISAYYRPSKEVGGDYYDFISIDENHTGIIVADVSGKGVPGSLVMSMARAFIRMEAERSHNVSTASTMVYANRMLAQDIKKGMFVTAIYAVLDHATREMCVSSAGHNPLILIKGSGEIRLINPKGIALGFDKGPVFERTITEEKIPLEKGDRVVLYTDGAVEAMNEKNEEFGDKKFEHLCRELTGRESGEFLRLVIEALDAHKGAAPQHDDLTVVTFRLN